MSEVMTKEEIEKRFESEWILREDPETTAALDVVKGKVLWHCKDREEPDRKALELRPKRSALLDTGTFPEDQVIVL